MKYKYELELYGDGGLSGSMITFLYPLPLELSKDATQLIDPFGVVIFDTNGETIISFGKDLYHEG